MSLPKDILKKAREVKGLTQDAMAERISKELGQSYSLRQYQRLEDGEFPKFKRLIIESVDKILGTALYDIIYDVKDDKIIDRKNGENENGQTPSHAEIMLADLIRAHNKQADSLKDVSEANLIWARNTERLISKMGTTADVEQETHADLSEAVARIAAVLVMLGTGTRWTSEQEAKEAIGNIVPLPGWGK